MGLLILADYYEEKYLIKKAHRLRKRKPSVFFGYYGQYNKDLGGKYYYGYDQGNGCYFDYGYRQGNGFWYR